MSNLNEMANSTLLSNQPNYMHGLASTYKQEKKALNPYYKNIADELEEQSVIKGLALTAGSKIALPVAAVLASKDSIAGFNNASKRHPYRTTNWQKTAGGIGGLLQSLSLGLVSENYIADSFAPSTKEQMLEGIRAQKQREEIVSWKK